MVPGLVIELHFAATEATPCEVSRMQSLDWEDFPQMLNLKLSSTNLLLCHTQKLDLARLLCILHYFKPSMKRTLPTVLEADERNTLRQEQQSVIPSLLALAGGFLDSGNSLLMLLPVRRQDL